MLNFMSLVYLQILHVRSPLISLHTGDSKAHGEVGLGLVYMYIKSELQYMIPVVFSAAHSPQGVNSVTVRGDSL